MDIKKDKYFLPDRFVKEALPRGFWERNLLTRDLNPKQSIIRAVVAATAVTKREIDGTYRRAIEFYDNKIEKLKDEGVRAYKKDSLHGERLLRARVHQLIIYNEVQELKKEHKGKRYRWLPSAAHVPEPEHQLLYGKIFNVGEGDKDGNMPGERWGCQCGIEWLDD